MKKTVLITGGAGFIGTNASVYYLKRGNKVIIFDNLSRAGAKQNLDWLKKFTPTPKFGVGARGDFVFIKGDVKDDKKLLETFKKYKPDLVLHLAAQVAMTTSVENPRYDFEVNALGTLNVLEAMRKTKSKAPAIYSSTNKVLGDLSCVPIIEGEKRYSYKNIKGVNENFPLDFHGPYGCSKGCGDQYFLDYARIFGLNTIVFRQSAIYGPHQFGIEDQGWIAWTINKLIFDKLFTIYGDGKQVRDVLYIDDLIEAFEKARRAIKKTRGQPYTIGGGKFNLSLLELFDLLEEISGKRIKYLFSDWRPGDQKVYISDITRAKKDFNWTPKVSPKEGVKKLYDWIAQNKSFIEQAGVFKK